jgi:hypothetical protein
MVVLPALSSTEVIYKETKLHLLFCARNQSGLSIIALYIAEVKARVPHLRHVG